MYQLISMVIQDLQDIDKTCLASFDRYIKKYINKNTDPQVKLKKGSN